MGRLRALGAGTKTGLHVEDQHDGDRRTGFNSDEWARLQFTYQENLIKPIFHVGKVVHRNEHVVGMKLLEPLLR